MTKRIAVLAGLLALSASLITPVHAATQRAEVERWSSTAELATGSTYGTTISGGAVRLTSPRSTYTYADPWGTNKKTTWELGSWTSPWARSGAGTTRLVPSWNLSSIPAGTWAWVTVRVRKGSTVGSWDTVAHWGYPVSGVRRASGTSQTDDLASLAVDTVKATKGSFDSWQIRVHLLRKPGSKATPVLTSVSGVTSTYATRSAATSRTTMTASKVLSVPTHSQMLHRNHHKEWNGGGAAWCSPTSMAMVLRFWGSGPKPSHYAGEPGPDGFVDHAARYTYDHRYRGTGNWAFTTAYAGRYGLDSFVTRLHDLREAEKFIKAGIPVVASVAFGRGGLTGAPLSSTPGHLMVIVGFTKDGKVVVNDPAAPGNSTVRRTYSRAQFEKAWLNGSGGIVYVTRPESKPLPAGGVRW